MATRVTDAEKDRMRELRDDGWTYLAIGLAVGRSRTAVICACDDKARKRRNICQKLYKKRTPEKQREWNDGYSKIYRQSIQPRLAHNMRSRLWSAISHCQKTGSAVRDLGCTINELRDHLEAQFQQGMTWDNWTRDGWHIDHIKPLASFDLTDREQFKEACHYTNLQPLWAEENLSKGAKLAWEAA